ncbi:hypothetical protein CSUI_006582 [Cystoisospora suis]|uniref:Uncharacterized protein n=1 Tax=Cystoisospora suis TaxID=483139 RepID=A0A2C6KTV9_9APIC|nr:hypothetical protein CSUI_006582 [Cystoisospora suis]
MSPAAAFSVKSSDLRLAQKKQLQHWLKIAATGVFSDLAWGCFDKVGTPEKSEPCLLQWEAQFCVANYLLVDALNANRGYSREEWVARDGSTKGLDAMARLCQPRVDDWVSKRKADCERAMRNINGAFPSAECS